MATERQIDPVGTHRYLRELDGQETEVSTRGRNRIGLKERKSKFKIRNNGSEHVFVKKSTWTGTETTTEIPLVEVTSE